MPQIEQKIIKNKPFFYLSEQINLKGKYKKIQVYLGKSIPNQLGSYYNKLKIKELDLFSIYVSKLFKKEREIPIEQYKALEQLRIEWKYYLLGLSISKREQLWRRFAVQFIFESNAIEGSRLNQKEVESIVKKYYIKKTIEYREIQEVRNAIRAFELILSGDFKLNQRTLINLHALVTRGLDIEKGYKKKEIVVNNKETTRPGKVRSEMAGLISWWKKERSTKRHRLFVIADFHRRFEHVHPFEDGNGRVGRLIFIWMLLQAGYPPILFQYKNRRAYFEALNQADEGRKKKWYWLCARVYKKTVRDFLD